MRLSLWSCAPVQLDFISENNVSSGMILVDGFASVSLGHPGCLRTGLQEAGVSVRSCQ